MTSKNRGGFATKSIHVGNKPDEKNGAIAPAIYATSTFVQKAPSKHLGFEYTRTHNPTRSRLEECLNSLEEGKGCVVTSSGMSAMSLVLHSLEEGAKVLCGDDVYGGTYRQFTTIFQNKLNVEFVDTSDTKSTVQKIHDFKPSLIWIETPTNPLLKVSDISSIAKASKKVGSHLLVDSTFMTPYFQKPLELGANTVLHSMTKYINGHSDALGGAIISNDIKFLEKLRGLQNSLGPSLSPFDSWIILRGIKTLEIRMEKHQQNALQISKFLESHKGVKKVIYPGLRSHPGYKVMKKNTSGNGGMISFYLRGGLKESNRFLKKIKLFSLAESLGGVESLVEQPATMTHASIPKIVRESIGIEDSLIRLSVGIENVKDLIEDLDNAIEYATLNIK